jgi:hypothetical protein
MLGGKGRTLAVSRAPEPQRGSWVSARRGPSPVSSRSPLSTGLAPLKASGSAPLIVLHGVTMTRRFPFRQFHRGPPVYSLRVPWVPLFPSFQRLGAFAISPHPGVPSFPGLRLLCPIRLFLRALAFRWGLPCLRPTRLHIPHEVSRVHHGRLKRNAVGGVLLSVPRPRFAAPQAWHRGEDRLPSVTTAISPSGSLWSLLSSLVWDCKLAWLTSQTRSVRVRLSRRAFPRCRGCTMAFLSPAATSCGLVSLSWGLSGACCSHLRVVSGA